MNNLMEWLFNSAADLSLEALQERAEHIMLVAQTMAIIVAVSLGVILVCEVYSFSRGYADRWERGLNSENSRFTFIAINSFLLVLLFMNPPTTVYRWADSEIGLAVMESIKAKGNVDYSKPKDPHAESNAQGPEKCDDFVESEPSRHPMGRCKLIEAEVQKVTTEIQARIGYIDTWYHWKFGLVGGLIVVFLKAFAGPFQGRFHETLISPASAVALASSCVISVAADIHIRLEGAITGMLGRWLADYVEPVNQQALYWENFLRWGTMSLHTSWITQFTFAPHLHFLTWPLYICYVWVFQEIALQGNAWTTLIKGSFLLVHSSLLIFVLVAHSTPMAYGLMVFHSPPGYSLALFLFLFFVLVTLNMPYFGIADAADRRHVPKRACLPLPISLK